MQLVIDIVLFVLSVALIVGLVASDWLKYKDSRRNHEKEDPQEPDAKTVVEDR